MNDNEILFQEEIQQILYNFANKISLYGIVDIQEIENIKEYIYNKYSIVLEIKVEECFHNYKDLTLDVLLRENTIDINIFSPHYEKHLLDNKINNGQAFVIEYSRINGLYGFNDNFQKVSRVDKVSSSKQLYRLFKIVGITQIPNNNQIIDQDMFNCNLQKIYDLNYKYNKSWEKRTEDIKTHPSKYIFKFSLMLFLIFGVCYLISVIFVVIQYLLSKL